MLEKDLRETSTGIAVDVQISRQQGTGQAKRQDAVLLILVCWLGLTIAKPRKKYKRDDHQRSFLLKEKKKSSKANKQFYKDTGIHIERNMAGRRRNVNIGANSIVYSGRGRPRTKETVDRPLPVGIVLGSPSPGSEIFKNRKIRVGGPFQAKVPKRPLAENDGDGISSDSASSCYQSSRPAPSRVSTQHPHLIQDQVIEYEREQLSQKHEKQNRVPKQEGEGKTCQNLSCLTIRCGGLRWCGTHQGCQAVDVVS